MEEERRFPEMRCLGSLEMSEEAEAWAGLASAVPELTANSSIPHKSPTPKEQTSELSSVLRWGGDRSHWLAASFPPLHT